MHQKYTSRPQRVWRNLMVCGINAGLLLDKFSLDAADQRPGLDDSEQYDFQLPNGVSARASVRQISHGELRFIVVANPLSDRPLTVNAGLQAGEAFATGWLERMDGKWLQFNKKGASCKRNLLVDLSELVVAPQGYADYGAFIF